MCLIKESFWREEGRYAMKLGITDKKKVKEGKKKVTELRAHLWCNLREEL